MQRSWYGSEKLSMQCASGDRVLAVRIVSQVRLCRPVPIADAWFRRTRSRTPVSKCSKTDPGNIGSHASISALYGNFILSGCCVRSRNSDSLIESSRHTGVGSQSPV
jgi:hypothetical protein